MPEKGRPTAKRPPLADCDPSSDRTPTRPLSLSPTPPFLQPDGHEHGAPVVQSEPHRQLLPHSPLRPFAQPRQNQTSPARSPIARSDRHRQLPAPSPPFARSPYPADQSTRARSLRQSISPPSIDALPPRRPRSRSRMPSRASGSPVAPCRPARARPPAPPSAP